MKIATQGNYTTAHNLPLKSLTEGTSSTFQQSTIFYIVSSASKSWTIMKIAAQILQFSTERHSDVTSKSDAEELEWENIVTAPRVQLALRRLAIEARRQNSVGETEEGGFAVE